MSRVEGHQPSSTGYRKLLFGLFLAGVATFAQLYSPQGLLPLISQDLHIGPDQAALLISMGTLGLAVSVIPWSFVGDRLGRKKAMGISVVAACVFALATVVGPNFETVLLFRLAEGLCLGGVPALALAYLSEEVDRKVVGSAAGTFVAGTVVGGLAGRIIAAPLGEWLHWRAGLLTVALIAVVCAVGFLLITPPARRFTPAGTTLRGGLTAITGNLRSPTLVVMYLQGMLLMGGFVAIYNYLGFHLLQAPFNLPLALVSLVFLAYVAGTVTSPWAGRMAGRYGPRVVLVWMILSMIAAVLLTLIPTLWVILVALVIFTGAFFGAHSVAAGWAGASAEVGRAQSTALYNLCYYTGSSVFGWLGGLFLQRWGWFGLVGMTSGLAMVALGSLFFVRGQGSNKIERADPVQGA